MGERKKKIYYREVKLMLLFTDFVLKSQLAFFIEEASFNKSTAYNESSLLFGFVCLLLINWADAILLSVSDCFHPQLKILKSYIN